jgi:hypothetical protein
MMIAKIVSHTDIWANDEVIIINHHDGKDWHGIITELSRARGIDGEISRVIKLLCEDEEKELLLIDGDPIYLVNRPSSQKSNEDK